MKLAGTVLCFVGGWILATMLCSTFGSDWYISQTTYAERLQTVSPYTALAAGAIGLCVIGSWLREKNNS